MKPESENRELCRAYYIEAAVDFFSVMYDTSPSAAELVSFESLRVFVRTPGELRLLTSHRIPAVLYITLLGVLLVVRDCARCSVRPFKYIFLLLNSG